MTKIKFPRAMDPSRGIPPPKSKPRSRGSSAPSAPPVPATAQLLANDLVLVVTKRRSAPSSQPRKQQQVLGREEKFGSNTTTTWQSWGEKSSKQVPVQKVLQLLTRKRPAAAEGEEDENEEDEESDFEPEEFSVSDEEREIVIKNARRRGEQLLAETTSLVDELERMEDDVQRLQDEKVALLDKLLVCEGLAVNPYPPFRPLTRRVKLLRTNLEEKF